MSQRFLRLEVLAGGVPAVAERAGARVVRGETFFGVGMSGLALLSG